MDDLNGILRYAANFELVKCKVLVEFNLGEGFPVLDDASERDYHIAFHTLYSEIRDLRPRPEKARITSKLENEVQKVQIEHNGNRAPEDKLELLNQRLAKCARGEVHYGKFSRHGNLIAATILQKYGGRIRLENIGGEYCVRTTVEIQIPKSRAVRFSPILAGL